MRPYFLLLLAFVWMLPCAGQTDGFTSVDMPTILPSSPEATAFVKAGVGIVNLSTGMASVNIPLYTLKLRDFSFPISLGYSTQGLKTDEASSRVGLGWVLNASGMITRSVKGGLDEQSQHHAPPANFTVNSSELYNYCANAVDPNTVWDYQPDEFQFNFNGYSGKFVLDSDFVPRVTSTSNLKIVVDAHPSNSSSGSIATIKITTPDGVLYTFGGAYEQTTTHNIVPFIGFKDRSKTAFFLDQIDMPNGDNIVFSYAPIHTRVTTGVTQTYKIGKPGAIGEAPCKQCGDFSGYTSTVNRVEYDTRYLVNITTSNGLQVEFNYGSRPDLSYDNRLVGMKVSTTQGDGLKKYAFSYYDVPGSSDAATAPDVIGRFFLTLLRESNPVNSSDTSKNMDYTFSYDRLDQVPLPITGGQDYYGFYNGGNGDEDQWGSLIPPSMTSSGTVDLNFRNPANDYSKIGTLTKIDYPTGGTEEYTYEANTTRHIARRQTDFITVETEGNGSTGTPPVYTSTGFLSRRNQVVTINGSCANFNLSDTYVADPAHETAYWYVYDGDSIVESRSVLGYGPASGTVNLFAGHTYHFTLTVKDAHIRASASLKYDSSSVDRYDTTNVPIPGIRVRQIHYYDPLTASTHDKYYTYAALSQRNVSTGYALPVYFYHNQTIRSYCSGGGGTAFSTDCLVDVYSSSSMNSVYGYSGSGGIVYYNTVIESDDPTFKNGGTEYDFFGNDDGGNKSIVMGTDILDLPTGQFPTLAGMVFKTRAFDANFQIVRDEQNDYETLIDLSHAVSGYYIRERYSVNFGLIDWMDAFDVAQMTYGNYWNRLKKKTVTEYAGASASTTVTTYTYGTAANVLPAVVATTDSKHLPVRIENKYPTDMTGDAGYSLLVAKNIIAPVVQESHYRNDVLQQQKQTFYNDWFGDGKIVVPQKVQVKLSVSDILHDALIFNRYDRTGSVQQLQKANDVSVSYLWDSIYALPICQVKGALMDQIAFASFENSGQWGNWQVTTGAVSESNALSGTHIFSGTLTRTLSITGEYVVSLWTTGSATVNGASGTLQRSFNGWNLYEWKLSNPSTVTVQGTNLDDVRLFPKGAQMATYTYQPFVGVTSQCDVNSRFTFYEYDEMRRLHIIYDQERNIVKSFDYHYQAQP
jgi:hypothetical protein